MSDWYMNGPFVQKDIGNDAMDVGGTWEGANFGEYDPAAEGSSSNPYENALETGSYTRGQNVFDFLFGTTRKKYNAASTDYDAELSKMDYQAALQYAYNNPAFQAQEMRKAGINPDLNGIDFKGTTVSPQGHSGLAAAVSQAGTGDVIGAVSTVFGWIGESVTKIMSYAQMFQDLQGKKLDNAGKDLANKLLTTNYSTQVLDDAIRFGVALYGQGLYDDIQSDLSNKDLSNVQGTFTTYTFDKLSNIDPSLRGEYSRIFTNLVRERSPLLMSALYEKFGSAEQYRKDYNELMGRATNDDVDANEQAAFRELSSLMLDLFKANQKFQTDYYSSRSGSLSAEAENATDEYTYNYSSYKSDVMELLAPAAAEAEAGAYYGEQQNRKFLFDYQNYVNNLFRKHMASWGENVSPDSWLSALGISIMGQAYDSLGSIINLASKFALKKMPNLNMNM